jgi:hydroxyacylglutathione hydrolase
MLYTFKGNDELSTTYMYCRYQHCVIIDPSHALDDLLKILENKTLDAILLTHAHSDHVHLISAFQVPIYVHEQDRALLFDRDHNGYGKQQLPYQRQALKLLDMPEKILLEDITIQCLHTPGHTKGSVSFLIEDKLFTGDTLFKEGIGRDDLWGGNLNSLKSSILKLMKLPLYTKVYPGHDDITTLRHEKSHNSYIKKWLY